jgi:hypothetical protein
MSSTGFLPRRMLKTYVPEPPRHGRAMKTDEMSVHLPPGLQELAHLPDRTLCGVPKHVSRSVVDPPGLFQIGTLPW